MSIDQRTIDSVKVHEGFRSRVYKDHLGYDTIGYGTLVRDMELTEDVAEQLLVDRLQDNVERLQHTDGYFALSSPRRSVIIEMSYWMGVGGVLKFKRMWSAIRRGDFVDAAKEMRDSKTWRDKQLRPRMERLALRMEHGLWPGEEVV